MARKPNDILDELLVLRAQEGDKGAVAMLVKKWHKMLVMQAYRNTNEYEVAKDVVQDSWQAIIAKIGNLNDPAKFKTWASRIVHNKSISWVRAQQKERLIEQEYNQEQVEEVEEDNRLALLKGALGNLSSEQRTVISLFYVDHFSVSQIAEVMNCPVGTVKSRLFKARMYLKELIENNKTREDE
jgi:RNA polymerase sigma factor (sigma-70 family)